MNHDDDLPPDPEEVDQADLFLVDDPPPPPEEDAAPQVPLGDNRVVPEGGGGEGLMDNLLLLLRDFCRQSGLSPTHVLDFQGARHVLEAAAGNVDLAAQLYWDDYLAKLARLQPALAVPPPEAAAALPPPPAQARPFRRLVIPRRQRPPPQQHVRWVANLERGSPPHEDAMVRIPRRHRPPPPPPPAADGAPDLIRDRPLAEEEEEEEDERRLPAGRGRVRAVRRHLEPDFNRHADRRAEEEEEDQDDEEEDRAIQLRLLAQARESAGRLMGARNHHHDPPGAHEAPRPPDAPEQRDHELAEGQVAEAAPGGAPERPLALVERWAARHGRESVSVSDDESGGVWRMVGGFPRRVLARRRQSSDSDPPGKRRKVDGPPNHESDTSRGHVSTEEKDEDEDDDEDGEDGYLSDNDWLWECLANRNSIPLCPPSDLLWGFVADSAPSAPSSSNAPLEDDAKEKKDSSNVICDEDDDEVEDDDDEEGGGAGKKDRFRIPRTWLRAGFTLSTCTNGLAVQPPTEDDVAYVAWQRQAQSTNQGGADSRQLLAIPHHCGGLTALLSLVTGLLYTGASYCLWDICGKRTPFLELSAEDRKRQFESRLADALAALLFVAAQASLRRKERALKYMKDSKDPALHRKWQRLAHKLPLCPTCGWEPDASTHQPRLPEGRESDKNLRLAVSYTNIRELRSYVLSNMRSFTGPGGCALFLETIVRIHGKGAILRMMRRAKKKAGVASHDFKLIGCTCEVEANKKVDKKFTGARKDIAAVLIDATQPGHKCISIELLSLLLTGRVHSTLKGWSTGPLGLGILSDQPGEVGRELTRPTKPVWILRGPTCYSVMWLKGSHDHPESFSRINRPGSVTELSHWNCWYRQSNKTDLRLVANRSKWQSPAEMGTEPSAAMNEVREAMVDIMCTTMNDVLRRRLERMEAAEDDKATENQLVCISAQELDRIKSHPDDAKYYPGKYRMWRFDVGDDQEQEKTLGSSSQSASHNQVWTAYHRLSARQKYLIEAKLGPTICTLLWTRWPGATVDQFIPPDAAPIV